MPSSCDRHLLTSSQQFIPDSGEAAQASSKLISYRRAVVNAYHRREALKAGSPYAMICLGYGTDFLYADGRLCYRRSHLVHVVDVHRVRGTELVFNLDIILRGWTEKQKGQARLKLLHYQEGILTVNVTVGQTRRLMVLDTQDGLLPQQRFLASLSPPRSKELLLRNNKKQLVVGVRGPEDGDKGWVFYLQDISRRPDGHTWPDERKGRPVELCTTAYFSTTDIGTTLAVEIIDDALWLMTSEVTPDPEGLDPTSFYGGLRYDLTGQNSAPEYWRFVRRKQNEGPINDLWTNIRLSKDERGEYFVSETRREWLSCHPDDALRSFYTINFQPHGFAWAYQQTRDWHEELERIRDNLPEEDVEYVDLLLEALPSKFFADWTSQERTCHREFPSAHHGYSTLPPASTPVFTAPNTPYRFYDQATSTFVDLVNDPANTLLASEVNLRLRTGHKGSDISFWPALTVSAADVPQHLRALLQPPSLRSFRAFHDERCIVYGACAGKNSPIVLVTFDPSMSFASAKPEPGQAAVESYGMPIGQYPAQWTREAGWRRRAPRTLDRI